MAEEIVRFLKKKFCDDVEINEIRYSKIVIYSQYPFSNQSLYNHFVEIKKLLEIFDRSLPADQDIEKIREKLYCLNDLWTEFKAVSNRDQATRINLRKKLTKIKEELKSFKGDSGKALSRTSSKQADGEAISSTQPSAVSNVYGFANDVTVLEKVLVRPGSEDRFKAIGIMGKAGIGKTALCQFLFNNYKPEVIKDYFLPRIWISMSTLPVDEQDQKVAILERMLESLGVEKETINKGGHDLKGLLYALHLQLQGKRYLIMLDDASNTDEWYGQLNSSPTRVGEWDRLSCGLPKGCGGAVLVTSRNEEVAKKMVGGEGEGFLHRVLPLSDPESSWKIFIQAAEKQYPDRKYYEDSELPINLEILKREILQRCAGLPLTATMMGKYEKFLY